MKQKSLFIAIIATVLIISVLTVVFGMVHLLSSNRESQKASFERTNFEYSSDVRLAFVGAFDLIVGEGGTSTIPDFATFRDRIYKSLREARVSQTVVEKVIAEIKCTDWSDEGEAGQFVKDLVQLEKDEENTLDLLVNTQNVESSLDGFFAFLEKTGATSDEMGRFLYRFILNGQCDEVFYKVDENDFAIMTAGTVALLNSFDQEIFGSLSSSRTFLSGLVTLGYAYKRIIKSVGKNDVKTLVGLDVLTKTDGDMIDSSKRAEYLEKATFFTDNFGDVFSEIADLLTRMPYEFFEELYDYNALKKGAVQDDYTLLFAYKRLSDEIVKSFDNLSSNRTTDETVDFLAKFYASAKCAIDILYGNTDSFLDDYTSGKTMLKDIFDNAKVLSDIDAKTLDDVKSLDDKTVEKGLKSAKYLENLDFDFSATLNYFMSGITLASIAFWI